MYICTWQNMGATSCHVITCHVIIRRMNPSTSYVIRRHPVHVNNECMRTYAQKWISVISTIIILIVTSRLTRMNKASRHGVTASRHGVNILKKRMFYNMLTSRHPGISRHDFECIRLQTSQPKRGIPPMACRPPKERGGALGVFYRNPFLVLLVPE